MGSFWQENLTTAVDNKTVIVGMPNKWEKLELICQKLTEIGIQNIIVYFSKRSIIKQSNKNKITRINKIIRESVEQSFGIIIPTLSWEDNLTFDTDDLIFYEWWEKLDLAEIWNFRNTWSIVIWPEWWWDEVELDMFRASWMQVYIYMTYCIENWNGCYIMMMDNKKFVIFFILWLQYTLY